MNLRKQIIIYIGLGAILGLAFALVTILVLAPALVFGATVLYAFTIPVIIILEAIALTGLCQFGLMRASIVSIFLNIISVIAMMAIIAIGRWPFPYGAINYAFPVTVGLLGVACLFNRQLRTTGWIAIGAAVVHVVFLAVTYDERSMRDVVRSVANVVIVGKYCLVLISIMCAKTMVEYWALTRSFKPDVSGRSMLIVNASVIVFLALATAPIELVKHTFIM